MNASLQENGGMGHVRVNHDKIDDGECSKVSMETSLEEWIRHLL